MHIVTALQKSPFYPTAFLCFTPINSMVPTGLEEFEFCSGVVCKK